MELTKLQPLECLMVTQTENGTTEVKKFIDEIELAMYLIKTYAADIEGKK